MLVAHGHGTSTEPYAIDVQDPQVQHAAQTEVGARELCHIVAAFNRIARLLPFDELDAVKRHGPGPTFQSLRAEVERCAKHFGLATLAHVIVLEQPYSVAQLRPFRPRNASILRSPPATPSSASSVASVNDDCEVGTPLPQGISHAEAHFESLSELVRKRRDLPLQLTPSDCTRSSSPVLKVIPRDSIPRLCLVLADCRRTCPSGPRRPSFIEARDAQQRTVVPTRTPSPLTTYGPLVTLSPQRRHTKPVQPAPMPTWVTLDFPLACPCQETWDLLQHITSGAHPPWQASEPCGFCYWEWHLWQWRIVKQRWRMRLQVWADWLPPAVLSLIAILWLADLLAFYLLGVMLLEMSLSGFTVYLLCPPLVQPLILLLGPIFLLIEVPRLGRLWAMCCRVGIIGPLGCGGVLFWYLQQDLLSFEFLELMVICAVKFILSVCARAYVNNVEIVTDLEFLSPTFLSRYPDKPKVSHAPAPVAYDDRPSLLSQPLLGGLTAGPATRPRAVDTAHAPPHRHRLVSLDAVVRGEE